MNTRDDNGIIIPFRVMTHPAIVINQECKVVDINSEATIILSFAKKRSVAENWKRLLDDNRHLAVLIKSMVNDRLSISQNMQLLLDQDVRNLHVLINPINNEHTLFLIQINISSHDSSLVQYLQRLYQDVRQIEFDVKKLVSNISDTIFDDEKYSREFKFASLDLTKLNTIKDRYPELTQYELEVCSLIAAYYSVDEIALILNKSSQSIRGVVYRISQKLSFGNSKDLIVDLCS
ncbi:MAG TPA: hypothetical protein VK152_08305 [Paludibacter sp.]|nr:hypothetical protein [Paludibacter sp.]